MASLRTIPIAKVILLSIITLGIYYLVTVYRNTKDIQNARAQGFEMWQLIFWIGVFVPIVQYVNYIMNGIGLGEIREQAGLAKSSTWIIALVLTLLLPIVGPIVWAVHFNGSVNDQGADLPRAAASPA